MPNFSTFSQHHYPRTKYYCIKKSVAVQTQIDANTCNCYSVLQQNRPANWNFLENMKVPTQQETSVLLAIPILPPQSELAGSFHLISEARHSLVFKFCYYKHFQYPVILPGCHLHFYITSGIPS